MKTKRRTVVPPTAAGHEQARQRLRAFAEFIERQDPQALAASVDAIDSTLEHCAKIDQCFRR